MRHRRTGPGPVAYRAVTDSNPQPPQGASYAAAGVDIEAGDRAVELFKPHAKRATRPEVLGGLGGFAGLFALKWLQYPLIALAVLAVVMAFRAPTLPPQEDPRKKHE